MRAARRSPGGRAVKAAALEGRTTMKLLTTAFAALLAASAIAYADEPAKVMDSSAGKIWTDAKGMTLYTYDKDEAGKSNCYDQCATNWPPLAAAADAAAMDEWTVVERTDGTKMWAYDGHPLYTFIGDKAAGDVTGDGKGGVWHVAKAEE
jgi:predicted lipoprotein with Yx(FWY)xxD motif